MRTDIPPQINRDGLIVRLWLTGTPRNLIVDTGGLMAQELAAYATAIQQSDSQTTIRLSWAGDRFSGVNRPQLGRPVSIQSSDPFTIWNGIVDQVSGDIESRGRREMTIVARSRDSTPWWRDLSRFGPAITSGTDLAAMAREICIQLGLNSQEFAIPDTGIMSTHSFSQLADHSAWKMLQDCLLPSLQEPWVDARGIFRPISRDVRRLPDVQLTDRDIMTITSGYSLPAYARVRLKWTDPELVRIEKIQDGAVGAPILTVKTVDVVGDVGFTLPNVMGVHQIWWDDKDHRQRADHLSIRLVSRSYTNYLDGSVVLSNGLPFFTANSPFGALIANLHDARPANPLGGDVPDLVALGLPPNFNTSDDFADATYEIYGRLYDYAPGINEEEAVDAHAPIWISKFLEIANDLIPSRAVARGIAVNELRYWANKAASAGVTISDNMQIERGDIVGLPDGRRLYVEGYQRDLTRGSSQVLQLKGFWVGPICRT